MQKFRLSEELINISTMMMVAHDRGEMIKLAGDLNGIIQQAMEIETESTVTDKRKASSALIKFTKQEIEKMSKTFKKEFIANGLVARIIKRPSGKSGFYYEIRYRRNGYNISVSNKDLKKTKELFVEATKNLGAPETKNKKLQFGTVADEWLEFKKNKIAYPTWQGYKSYIQRFLDEDFCKKLITEIRTADIDCIMRQFDRPRFYEDMRTVFNSIFKYAIASGLIAHNPVALVPFKRAERQNRDSLSYEQIKRFLKNIKEPRFDRIRQAAFVFYFFGIRPCELDEEAHFENGFLVCRNRKRKNGKVEYKKIPIPKQAQGLIDFDKPILPSLSYDRWLDLMKEALGKDEEGNDLTPYNLRHTFASICSEAVAPQIVELWMGDSPERLVGKVYVHFKDDFMQEQMQLVKFPV